MHGADMTVPSRASRLLLSLSMASASEVSCFLAAAVCLEASAPPPSCCVLRACAKESVNILEQQPHSQLPQLYTAQHLDHSANLVRQLFGGLQLLQPGIAALACSGKVCWTRHTAGRAGSDSYLMKP